MCSEVNNTHDDTTPSSTNPADYGCNFRILDNNDQILELQTIIRDKLVGGWKQTGADATYTRLQGNFDESVNFGNGVQGGDFFSNYLII